MKKVTAILSLLSISFSLSTFAQSSSNCWNFRDDSGLKVCTNDKVKVIKSSGSKILAGPLKVIGLEDDGVVVLQYITQSGKAGFTRKAMAEQEIIVMENRQFDSKAKIGDQIVRSSDSKVFEVIGLGANDAVGIKLGADLDMWLDSDGFTKLSK